MAPVGKYIKTHYDLGIIATKRCHSYLTNIPKSLSCWPCLSEKNQRLKAVIRQERQRLNHQRGDTWARFSNMSEFYNAVKSREANTSVSSILKVEFCTPGRAGCRWCCPWSWNRAGWGRCPHSTPNLEILLSPTHPALWVLVAFISRLTRNFSVFTSPENLTKNGLIFLSFFFFLDAGCHQLQVLPSLLSPFQHFNSPNGEYGTHSSNDEYGSLSSDALLMLRLAPDVND